ncbi:unnamed protein product [Auanema sp. JU1783]|nr:unnamed protein product [Auanema sp. JU1783]
MTLCASSNNPATCIDTHFLYTFHSRYTADCSDTIFQGPCYATIAIGKTEDVIAISFKGSANVNNFKTNGQKQLNDLTMAPFETFGNVADDYVTAFERLWSNGLGDAMMELSIEFCDYTILAVGHSTGCCLSQMLLPKLVDLDLFPPSRLIFYGYGCPRCGDQEFAASVDSSTTNAWRVNWIDDNIVNTPSTTCARNAKAKKSSGTSCWFHCCSAAVAKNVFLVGLRFTTCAVGESTTCTAGTKSSTHYDYWNTESTDYEDVTCTSTSRFTVMT